MHHEKFIRDMHKKTIGWLVSGALLASCSGSPSAESTPGYKTLTVALSDQTLLTEYSARLAGRQVVEVRPQVSGYLTQICIEEGDRVRKGQTLFVIEQDGYQASYDEAVATVKSAVAQVGTAQLALESTQALYDAGVVQDYDLKMAQLSLQTAEAALLQAQAQEASQADDLQHTVVKSPVDGVAGMINFRVGALVSSSSDDPLVTVADDSQIYAYFSLSESQLLDMIAPYGSLDQLIEHMPPVSLRLSNGQLYPATGRIAAVSGIVSAGTGAVTLRADFPGDAGLLRDGGSGSVIIPHAKEGCIVIPQAATYDLQGRVFVYKVIGGKASSAPVSVYRLNDGNDYVVEEGLSVGDTIVAEGAGLVREGAIITGERAAER